MLVSRTTRLIGWLFGSLRALAADGRDLGVDLPHGQLISTVPSGGCPGLLEPSRGIRPELLKKTLPVRFGGRVTAYNRLWGVGDPPAFHLRLQNVAAADAELFTNGLGDDYLKLFFTVTMALGVV
jgi:hypothetical protein